MSRFERILDQLPFLEEVKIMGAGEPFLHERFFDLVRAAKRRGIRVKTITNGTLLGRSELRQEILDSGLDDLGVSINGAKPETHARWKGGSDLHEILFAVRMLAAKREKRDRPRLRFACVGTCDNRDELPALIDLAMLIGVDHVTYSTETTPWGKPEPYSEIHPINPNADIQHLQTVLAAANKRAAETGVYFQTYHYQCYDTDHPCSWPWISCFIRCQGQVTQCCIACDLEVHHFGNIDEEPFAQIWNSPGYCALRRAVRDGTTPEACLRCYRQLPLPNSPGESTVASLCLLLESTSAPGPRSL